MGSGDGGNPVGWFPGGGAFYSYSVSPDLKLGFAATGNFGLALKYDGDWAGRYYVQEGTLVGMSLVPSVGYRVNKEWSVGASLNAMYAKLHDQVAINNIVGADGSSKLDRLQMGLRRHARRPLRAVRGHALRPRVELADQARFLGPAAVLRTLACARDGHHAIADSTARTSTSA